MRRWRIDPFELWVLACLAALSLWMIGVDLTEASLHDLVWTRTDGFFPVDQLQYLAWIRAAAAHGLVSDMFVLRPTPADYLQPAILVSGLLVRAGVAPWLSLMLWKPVAVLAVFLAARALVHRCLDETIDRRIALVLALLFASLTDVSGALGVFGDMISAWQSWGYPFGLLAVALVVAALLVYDRSRSVGRATIVPGLLGGLAALLHPWQGELLFGVIVLAELVGRPRTRSGVALVVLTLTPVALALAYYFALGHLDPVWNLSESSAVHSFPWGSVLLAAAPLLVFALLGYRGAPADFLELALRMWIPATLGIVLLAVAGLGAAPQHALNGLPLAMAVLAVLGVRRSGLPRLRHGRWLARLGVALAVLPGTVFMLAYAHTFVSPEAGDANLVSPGLSRAFTALDRDPGAGGVLTGEALGAAVPGLTGRRTYVGDRVWSVPDLDARAHQATALLSGSLSPAATGQLIADTGARYVLGGCGSRASAVTRSLGTLVVGVRRFGCATVWQLRAAGRPTEIADASPGQTPP